MSYIESRIHQRIDGRGTDFVSIELTGPHSQKVYEALRKLTICMLIMDNGFVVIGKTATLSLENFNPALGQKFAYEDAIRQLWPMFAFARLEAERG